MPHSHGPHHPVEGNDFVVPEFRPGRTVTIAIRSAVGLAAALTILGLIVFWPSASTRTVSDPNLFLDPPIKATVTAISTAPCTGTTEADNVPCNFISLHLTGQATTPTPVVPRGGGPTTTAAQPTIEQGVSDVGHLRPGDDIYVNVTFLPDGTATFSFYDYQRATPMWVLTIAFVAAVLFLGGAVSAPSQGSRRAC